MLRRIVPLPTEAVELGQALGRVLGADVLATRDQPPFAASAMDGWAVRRADAAEGVCELIVVGESAAGRGWPGTLAPGQAVRISTGAPLPAGADFVVIQERAVLAGDRVRLGPLLDEPDYIRPQGGDFTSGRPLLRRGERLDPWRLALVAAAGLASVEVACKPVVTILTTGDEVVAPGSAAGPEQIYDAAGAGLQADCLAWGAEARLISARDDQAAISAALGSRNGDLIVTVGGASVGDHDLVKPALREFGLDLEVEGVAVRPGKPTWFGGLTDGRLVLGLPGNPASALVCAELFLRPILAALQGADPRAPFATARTQTPLPATGPREHLMRATAWTDGAGVLRAAASERQDSSLVAVLARSNALIRRPAGALPACVDDPVDLLWLGRPQELGGSEGPATSATGSGA